LIEISKVRKEFFVEYNKLNEEVKYIMQNDAKKTETALYWDYICDEKLERYNFKQIYSSCVNLLNNTEEIKRIYQILNQYIDSVAKLL
jgi:Skp family chaperone for outer membrane proteins